jgi:hypothetical protein
VNKYWRNLFISILFFVSLLLLSVLADRVTGAFLNRGAADEGLIFPPHSTFRYQTPEFDFTASINSRGFRDREFDLDKSGQARILAVGDSFTFGWGVSVAEAWPRLLETGLRQTMDQVEVANLGQPGAAPDTYARTVEKAVPVLRPDLIVVCILQGDDLVPEDREERAGKTLVASSDERTPPAHSVAGLREKASGVARRIYPNFLRLVGTHLPHPPLNSLWKSQADSIIEELTPEERVRFDKVDVRVKQSFMDGELNPALMQGAIRQPNHFLDTYDIERSEVKSMISRMTRNLARIKEAADRYHSRVVVVSIPYKVYASRRDLESSQRLGLSLLPEMVESDSADRAIETACKGVGLEFLEVTNEFRKAANATHLFYEMDGHLNTEGHRVFAKLLTPILADWWTNAKTVGAK